MADTGPTATGATTAVGGKGSSASVTGDDRLDPKELVVGVDFDGLKKAYPFNVLDDQPVLNDSVDDRDAPHLLRPPQRHRAGL